MSEAKKDRIARIAKVPLHLLPAAGALHGAMACWDGAVKKAYGAYNWRTTPISYMEMIGAMERHIAALKDGNDYAEDSGVHHLGHINACTAILLDAEASGTLIDDRPTPRSQVNVPLMRRLPSLMRRRDRPA
jgi:hypothetical protein